MGKSLEFLELDFYDPNDAIIALTFSSADFRNIGGNNGTHSKTIKMPSTKVNDTFFGMAFEATNEGIFDPLIKVPIQISEIEFFGTLQLKSIEILQSTPQNYVVNIFGDLTNWVSLIGEKSIRSLRFWDGISNPRSHRLDEETISATWGLNGLTGSYVYPLINYGNSFEGVEPTDNIDVAFMRPAFFALPIIKNIFKEIGYTFIDKGISETKFRDAILPFTSKETELISKVVEARSTSAQEISLESTNYDYDRVVVLEYPFETLDSGKLFNNSTNIYTAPAQDNYTINMQVDLSLGSDNHEILPRKIRGSVKVVMLSDEADGMMGKRIEVLSNSSEYGDLFSERILINRDISLVQGESIKLALVFTMKKKTSVDAITQGFMSIKPLAATLTKGDLLTHSKVVQNSKQIDLIKDILRKGNFRIVTDNQRKTVEFIQNDKFLTTSPEDWSNKKDESRLTTLSLIQNQGAKELEWNYSNDSSDGFITDRERRKDEDYAQHRVSLDSEYRRGSQVIHTSSFSSTIDYRGIGLAMPVMSSHELEQGKPITKGLFETGFDNRILIYDGLRSGNFVLDGVAKTQYPFSYFKSNDFSLKWDSNEEFTTASGLTQVSFESGLVDRYYTRSIKVLNSSKLYTGWFFLSDLDISNLNFRRPKIIDDVHYYLNKVIDYKLNANEPTKVELISR